MFGRTSGRRDRDADITGDDARAARTVTPGGPYDEGAAPDDGLDRVDAGALRVPIVATVSFEVRVDPATRQPVAITATSGRSRAELMVLAAPKSRGLWADLRAVTAGSAAPAGSAFAEADGPYGRELRGSSGSGGRPAPVRILGIDGPRWMLQVTISGPAATDTTAAPWLDELLRGVVVVRGDEAQPPRAVLPLRVPGADSPDSPVGAAAAGDLTRLAQPVRPSGTATSEAHRDVQEVITPSLGLSRNTSTWG
jgi:hypothetical protein